MFFSIYNGNINDKSNECACVQIPGSVARYIACLQRFDEPNVVHLSMAASVVQYLLQVKDTEMLTSCRVCKINCSTVNFNVYKCE